MHHRTDLPRFWPLVEGSLTADTLRPFAPIACAAALDALKLGFLTVTGIAELIQENLLNRESVQLRRYVETADVFDRRSDIQQELEHLAAAEVQTFPPLWMILARMILTAYPSSDDAVETLEQLYEFADFPSDLRPFTLYGSPVSDGGSTTKQTTQDLDEYLKRAGL